MTLETDLTLLELLKQSNMAAFDELYNRYWQLLFRLAEKKTGDFTDSKDLIQELFIDLWNRRQQINIRTSLRIYLISALYLKIFKYFRSKGLAENHYQNFASFLVQSTDNIVSSQTTLNEAEQEFGAMQEVLEQVIANMPAQMQRVFTLKHLHQYSSADIASELDISIHTVKNHLKQGMIRLRKAGEQYPSALLLLTWLSNSSY